MEREIFTFEECEDVVVEFSLFLLSMCMLLVHANAGLKQILFELGRKHDPAWTVQQEDLKCWGKQVISSAISTVLSELFQVWFWFSFYSYFL